MQKNILKIASEKFNQLSKKYDKFINVAVDDWRGFRFIFDTEDVRKCNNDCSNCGLYKLLQKEKKGFFSAGLYPANAEDKKIFGPQNFLNCKTLEQYENCYVNFVTKRVKTKSALLNELKLLKQMSIIYSRDEDEGICEKRFKYKVINKILN